MASSRNAEVFSISHIQLLLEDTMTLKPVTPTTLTPNRNHKGPLSDNVSDVTGKIKYVFVREQPIVKVSLVVGIKESRRLKNLLNLP